MLADVGFTSHSFRRCGATELLTRNYAINFIVNVGRWASERLCKDYLRRGGGFSSQTPRSTDPTVWLILLLFTKLKASVWDLNLVCARLLEGPLCLRGAARLIDPGLLCMCSRLPHCWGFGYGRRHYG